MPPWQSLFKVIPSHYDFYYKRERGAYEGLKGLGNDSAV